MTMGDFLYFVVFAGINHLSNIFMRCVAAACYSTIETPSKSVLAKHIGVNRDVGGIKGGYSADRMAIMMGPSDVVEHIRCFTKLLQNSPRFVPLFKLISQTFLVP